MRLDQYISDLLYSTDCVIIPGLGGFVANTRTSSLNPAQHTFSPPTKRIAFNGSLSNNDGFLAQHLKNELDITYSDALKIIQSFVDESFLLLNAGESVKIEKVGTIYYNKEQHLQFDPDLSVNYLLDSFGLSTIHSPAIRREEGGATVRTLKSIKVTKAKGGKSRWRLLELVPAAAVLALLAFSPNLINNLNSSLSSIIPIESASNNTISVESSAKEVQAEYPEVKFNESIIVDSLQGNNSLIDTSISLASVDNKVEETSKASDTKETIEPTLAISTKVVTDTKPQSEEKISVGNFYVIGGCFKIYENAVKFQQEAFEKGFDAVIIGVNDKGLHMVSLFSSNNNSTTVKEKEQIQVEFQKDAWVYSKTN